MNHPHDLNIVSVGTCGALQQIEVQTATTEEQIAKCQKWPGEEHDLGPARTAGQRLFQNVYEGGEPVAVLAWAASAWHLKDRNFSLGTIHYRHRHRHRPGRQGRSAAHRQIPQ